MKNISLIVLFFVLILSHSCRTKEHQSKHIWSELPETTKINDLKKTEFVATLENPITENKNIIYAPAFLYAWKEVRKEFKSPIVANEKNSEDFKLLNQSTTFQNSLYEYEYSSEVDYADGAILASAFFNKTLPFPSKLQRADTPLIFDSTKVAAFGMYYFNEEAIKFSDILYYKDDDRFILRLTPKENHNEILLVKGIDDVKNLSEAVTKTQKLIDQGKKEKSKIDLAWKYTINNEDIFSIPVVKFNIASRYQMLEGQRFETDGKEHFIEIAYQRTGFILDENGAVVESEGYAAVDSVGASDRILPHPKKLILNKPFYIIVKHSKRTNPYFVMKVQNAELLTKF